MATLGSLTKSVPITPRKTLEQAGTPVISLQGADLIDEAISEISRYTTELTGFTASFPQEFEPTLNRRVSNTPDVDFFSSNANRPSENFLEQPGFNLDSQGYGIPPTGTTTLGRGRGISEYTSTVLSQNRFSGLGDDNKFVDTTQGVRSITQQGKLIRSLPSTLGTYSSDGDTGRALNLDGKVGNSEIAALQNIALSLLVKASGKTKLGESLESDQTDRNIRGNRAKSKIIPSSVQLGLTRVDGSNLLVSESDASLGSATRKSEQLGYAGGRDSGASYGTLNSPLQIWEDNTALLSAALIGALSLIGIASLFSLLGNNKLYAVNADVKTTSLGLGDAGLEVLDGRATRTGPGGALSTLGTIAGTLGLVPEFGLRTRHPTTVCITKGLRVFFGGGAGVSALDNFTRIFESSAYFATIIRSVVRDSEQITSALTELGSNPGSIFSLSTAIESSTTFRFLKTMAALGDVCLTADDPVDSALKPGRRRLGGSDLSNGNYGMLALLPQSYASSAAIGLLLGMPQPMKAEVLGRSESLTAPGASISNLSQIPIEEVRRYEDQFSAQAFPFTFHDMRTNELISFGAFITDLQDSFSPTYNSTEAYGRTESIMTYTSTKRDIQLGFYIVATNPTDFDLMWRKINKLVTLVYPQYSKGRLINKGGNTFRMPFSQVMTSSPMIRLRIGETITGNYSRFNLTRLFGTGDATQGGIAATGEAGTVTATTQDNREQEINVNVDAGTVTVFAGGQPIFTMSGELGSRLTLNTTLVDQNATQYFASVIANATSRAQEKYANGFEVDDYVVLKRDVLVTRVPVERANVGAQIGARLSAATGIGDGGDKLLIHRGMQKANTRCKVLRVEKIEKSLVNYFVVPVKNLTNQSADLGFLIDHSSLTFDVGTVINDALVQNEAGEEEASEVIFDADGINAFSTALNRFFSGEEGGNPIIRSFENTMSKGLAGFITNLSFDYNDSTYETAEGSRAPMFVKVSMGFSPIHDIAPGIDADGINRAPVYKVGHYNNLFAGEKVTGFTEFSVPAGDGVDAERSQREQALNAQLEAAREAATEQATQSVNASAMAQNAEYDRQAAAADQQANIRAQRRARASTSPPTSQQVPPQGSVPVYSALPGQSPFSSQSPFSMTRTYPNQFGNVVPIETLGRRERRPT
jgi:hypothetical protein